MTSLLAGVRWSGLLHTHYPGPSAAPGFHLVPVSERTGFGIAVETGVVFARCLARGPADGFHYPGLAHGRLQLKGCVFGASSRATPMPECKNRLSPSVRGGRKVIR